jgi:hypothetical protein
MGWCYEFIREIKALQAQKQNDSSTSCREIAYFKKNYFQLGKFT